MLKFWLIDPIFFFFFGNLIEFPFGEKFSRFKREVILFTHTNEILFFICFLNWAKFLFFFANKFIRSENEWKSLGSWSIFCFLQVVSINFFPLRYPLIDLIDLKRDWKANVQNSKEIFEKFFFFSFY